MVGQILSALLTVVIGVGAAVLYFWGTNWILDRLLRDDPRVTGPESVRRDRMRSAIRPWLFIFPAMFFLSIYLVYPVFESLRLSFMDRNANSWVGFTNYVWAFQDPQFLESVFNNILWLLIVPAASTAIGLLVAVLADRLWWGNIAKSLIFMPMAISFVGASVIWRFVYDYRGPDAEQIGVLNAVVQAFGLRSAGLDHRSLLEQHLPDGHPDLDSDRLCHGHPVARPCAAFPRRHWKRRASTAPTTCASSSTS